MIAQMAADTPPPRTRPALRVASTCIADPEQGSEELFRALEPSTLAGVLLFCSSRFKLDGLADAINRRSEGLIVFGCTSSGELTPEGIAEGTVTAIGFPAQDFALSVMCFEDLDHFDSGRAHERVREMVAEARVGRAEANRVALFLVDGLSHREEMLTITLQDALGEIPLIGGSSGDGLAFRETFIFHEGRFRRDAALVALLSSPRAMKVFRVQHYRPATAKMVITQADPLTRIVTEINAEPAAAEYARLAGASEADLGPALFASHPPMVRAGGEYYVRSIQSANPDGSLTFYCAIDEGVVLTLGEPVDIPSNLRALFAELQGSIGPIDRIIGFDCVLNMVEVEHRQQKREVSALFAANRVVGFSTYGEQYKALHVNQTFTGLAIGA